MSYLIIYLLIGIVLMGLSILIFGLPKKQSKEPFWAECIAFIGCVVLWPFLLIVEIKNLIVRACR